jgi:hypothetical protein
MIGTVLPGLFPANPWQALQTKALCAPGESSGPAAALDGANIMPAVTRANAISSEVSMARSFLTQDVVPDAGAPGERVLRGGDTLARRKLLFNLDDLAAFNFIGIDHRDSFLVVHPAVTGVARGEDGRLLAVQQMNDGRGANLSHGIGDVAGFWHRQPDGRIADDVNVFLLKGFVGNVIDFAPALVPAYEVCFDGDGGGALRRNQIDDVIFYFIAGFGRDFFRAHVDLFDFLRRPVV